MTCYKPLRAFVLGVKPNGKKNIKITGADCDTLIFNKVTKQFETAYFKDVSKSTILSSRYRFYRESMLVPCNQCVGCRLDYSRQWATRLMLEKKESTDAWFCTLTYEDSYLHNRQTPDPNTGEVREVSTLYKKDMQLFIKRLRYYCPDLRYYCAGEYGDKSARPHYHVVFFNLNLPTTDLRFYKRDNGNDLFTSEIFKKIWKFGMSILGQVTWQSCAYVARYVMKKQKGKNSKIYEDYDIEPPFVTMSLKPAIGKSYFDKNYQELVENPHLMLADGKDAPLPKAFLKYVDEEIAEELKEDKRKLAEELMHTKEVEYGLPYLEILKLEEQAMLANAKKYLRE